MLIAVAVGVIAAVALDHLLLRLEAKGWIYYRRVRPVRGAAANRALSEAASILDPNIKPIVEERREEHSGEMW